MFDKIRIIKNQEGNIVTAVFPTLSVTCEEDDDPLIIYLKLANAMYEHFGFEPADNALSTLKAIVMAGNHWNAGEHSIKKVQDVVRRNSILSKIENIPIETEKSDLETLGQFFMKTADHKEET